MAGSDQRSTEGKESENVGGGMGVWSNSDKAQINIELRYTRKPVAQRALQLPRTENKIKIGYQDLLVMDRKQREWLIS